MVSGRNSLIVKAKASVSVPATKASLCLTIETENKRAEKSIRENADRSAKLFATLENLGIRKQDISTSKYSVEERYAWVTNKETEAREQVFVGYATVNSLTVTINQIDKIGVVIDAAAEAGVDNIGKIAFAADDMTDAVYKALAEAVKIARKKAEVIASGLGITIGDILDIRESARRDIFDDDDDDGLCFPSAPSIARSAASTEVHSDNLAVKAGVEIVFEIKQ